MRQINMIYIGGYRYNVQINDQKQIIATECVGRWPMTTVKTGDKWLDQQLAKAVTERLQSESDYN